MRRFDSPFIVLAIAAAALIGVVVISLVFWRESDIVRNFAILASLAIAVPVGLWRIAVAARQASAAERSAEASAESAAVSRREALDAQLRAGTEMINSELRATRVAGAYLLRRLATEHGDEYDEIVRRVLGSSRAAEKEPSDGDR